MIRSSPCDFYLKCLISHPDQYEDHQIRTLVKLQRLDFLGLDHLKRMREGLHIPEPFYPEDLLHHASQRFLTKEKIFYLHHPDEDMILAIKLLDHPRGKELTESLLAVGAAPDWICGLLKRVKFKATPRCIELYRHFYFNTDLVTSTELRAILSIRASIDADPSDADAMAFKGAYWEAAKSDVRSLSEMPALSPFSNILNMMRLGIMPTGVEIARIATVARMAAVVRSAENSVTGHAKRALDFALTGKILNELMESVGDASGDLQKSMMNMLLETDSAAVPSIQQLTAGNYTMDLTPTLVEETEDVEASP